MVAQNQTRLTATELCARPTYAEEYQNIKDNVNLAVRPAGNKRDDSRPVDMINEDYENISHYSKKSIRRHRESGQNERRERNRSDSRLSKVAD